MDTVFRVPVILREHRMRSAIAVNWPPKWMDHAACNGYDPELWFPSWPKPNEYGQARRICARCPVRKECLELALKTDNRYGMFGGLTPGQRKKLKTPQPEQIPA